MVGAFCLRRPSICQCCHLRIYSNGHQLYVIHGRDMYNVCAFLECKLSSNHIPAKHTHLGKALRGFGIWGGGWRACSGEAAALWRRTYSLRLGLDQPLGSLDPKAKLRSCRVQRLEACRASKRQCFLFVGPCLRLPKEKTKGSHSHFLGGGPLNKTHQFIHRGLVAESSPCYVFCPSEVATCCPVRHEEHEVRRRLQGPLDSQGKRRRRDALTQWARTPNGRLFLHWTLKHGVKVSRNQKCPWDSLICSFQWLAQFRCLRVRPS